MKVAIIGAGASGLMLANKLEKLNIDYTIFNDGKIGRKILASGNGRCNISNRNLSAEYYYGSEVAERLIHRFKDELFDTFKELKIYTKDDSEGRMYPLSESSLSVLNALTINLKGEIVDLKVTEITKKNDKYYINHRSEAFDYVAIGIGSPSGLKNKPDYSVVESIGVRMNEFKPSLVGFKLRENVKAISGVRAKATVALYSGGILIHEEKGEVVFKDDGISGICIMNLSGYYNHNFMEEPVLRVSLVDEEYDSYLTVLNPKMLEYVEKNKLDPTDLRFNIKGTYDFEFSQVSSGGVDVSSLRRNLSTVDDGHIFFMGEVIDTDGICGGFNLSFAFLSAIQVSEAIKNEISD
ncbi:MAG: NAD(P)/FAD-dependent oxidoreductase [Acholeplasmatales bacterium]|nr:NAD(P)/FAD-dependent oxidoreductase [Acholeplasmatales bacterium]